MKTLDQIMLSVRTDKASLYHNYTPVYEHYFEPIRHKEIVLLELGIGDLSSLNREGQSIDAWRIYFSKGRCYAIDNDIEKVKGREGCYHCDQTDEGKLKMLIEEIGRPDIICDDASHIQSNTIKSFEILFPLLKSGGIYAVEDCVTAFWPSWEGNSCLSYNDNIFIDMSHETIFTYMFQLVYYVNLKRQETFNPPQSIHIPDWIKEIDSIHFHHSQIIIKKK